MILPVLYTAVNSGYLCQNSKETDITVLISKKSSYRVLYIAMVIISKGFQSCSR